MGETLRNITSASSCTCAAHWINSKNVNNTPQVEMVLLSDRGRETTSNLFTRIHSLLNYSDKDYATCPNNLHTLSGTLFRWPPCFFNILIPSMLAVLVTGTGSNQRQMGVWGGDRREGAIHKVTVYSSCIRGKRWGPASPFSCAGFSLDHLAFTPSSQLSHLKPFSTPTAPVFFFLSLSFFFSAFFTVTFLQIWLDTAGKGRDGQGDERMLHKGGGEWRIDRVRKARDGYEVGKVREITIPQFLLSEG